MQRESVVMNLPGYRAPAVGVESPFELLAACHDRVRRSLALLARLQSHVATHGCDDNARSAARDVLRYFDVAAPLHHQDEELHVFPVLLASADTALHALVHQLKLEHIEMETRWKLARGVLLKIADTAASTQTKLQPDQMQSLNDFSTLYYRHIQDEDLLIYPPASHMMTELNRHAMSQEMGARRGLFQQPERLAQ